MKSRDGLFGGGARGEDRRVSSSGEERPRDTRLQTLARANNLGKMIHFAGGSLVGLGDGRLEHISIASCGC